MEYDEIGNPTQYYNGKTYSMGWYGRKLLSVSMGGTYCSYGYDSDGQRISKTVGNDEYTYLYYGTKLMQYGKTDCYDLYFFYDDNDQPLGFYYKDVFTSGRGRKFYFVLNAQGDVVQLRDSQNRTVANYHYDAWGKLLSITDADGTVLTASSDDYYPTNAQISFINPIRYRGYVYDNETGFYYLNTRYYDPSLRRFISADGYASTGQGFVGYNMFAYCDNNPLLLADSDGNFPFLAITAAVGAAVGAVVGGVKAAKSGKSIWKGALKGAAVGGLVGLGAGAAAGALLAGSAVASTSAVVAGASAFATAVGTGGIGAGAAFVANNIYNAISGGGAQAATQAATQAVQTGKNIYYQVTSTQAAQEISNTGQLIPTAIEKSVCVLDFQPTMMQAQQIGAQAMETVIRFSTNCSTFIQDTTVQFSGAYRNMIDGAIKVFDVIEVGFK